MQADQWSLAARDKRLGDHGGPELAAAVTRQDLITRCYGFDGFL
jgi:hypothetical protein